MQMADLRVALSRLRSWELGRQPMALETDLEPDVDAAPVRAPSIEAVETEIARCRQLVDRIGDELAETRAVLDAAQQLAKVLGRMLDDARLEAAVSPGCLDQPQSALVLP